MRGIRGGVSPEGVGVGLGMGVAMAASGSLAMAGGLHGEQLKLHLSGAVEKCTRDRCPPGRHIWYQTCVLTAPVEAIY